MPQPGASTTGWFVPYKYYYTHVYQTVIGLRQVHETCVYSCGFTPKENKHDWDGTISITSIYTSMLAGVDLILIFLLSFFFFFFWRGGGDQECALPGILGGYFIS